MSASGITTRWFFAPPSACTRLPAVVAVRCTYSAIGVEPTKLTAATSSWVSSASTASLSPLTTFSTPRGTPASTGELGEAQPARRVLLRRLQHEGVAARERDRIHPHRDHGREVERGDPRAHAERLADVEAVHAARDVLVELALQELGDPARELDDLDAPGDRAAGVFEGLAVLGRAQGGELVAMRLDEVAVAEQDARTLRGRGRGPRRKCCLRRLHRLVDLAGGGERHLRLDLSGCRVVDVAETVALSGDAFAVDEVLKDGNVGVDGGHGSLRRLCCSIDNGNFPDRRGYHRAAGRTCAGRHVCSVRDDGFPS